MVNFCVFLAVFAVLGGALANHTHPVSQNLESEKYDDVNTGFEEIIVESSLNIKKKTNPAPRRTVRSVVDLILPESQKNLQVSLKRVKRQRRRQRPGGVPAGIPAGNNNFGAVPGFGASSANANANAFNQQFGPNGFGSSASNAQAQSFQNQGPLGGFGASAANSASQGFNVGPGGITGSAGQSGSQVYNLPNGHSINLAYSNGFSIGPDGRPTSANGNSITYT